MALGLLKGGCLQLSKVPSNRQYYYSETLETPLVGIGATYSYYGR